MSHAHKKSIAQKMSPETVDLEKIGRGQKRVAALRQHQDMSMPSDNSVSDKEARKQTARMIAYQLRRATTIRLDS